MAGRRIVKVFFLGWSFVLVASVDPSAIQWVLLGSALFGGLGGWASAKANGHEQLEDRINHVISMAVFGCSVSMLGFWWNENDAGIGGAMVGISGICGLIGSAIFVPVKALVEKLIGAISPDWVFKAIRKLASEDKNEKPDV